MTNGSELSNVMVFSGEKMQFQPPAKLKQELTSLTKGKERNDTLLLSGLKLIQKQFHYLPEEALIWLGTLLQISITKLYSVASFYSEFSFIPQGTYHIKLCNNISCITGKNSALLNLIKEELSLLPGEITSDGLFSLELVSCLGACDRAPVIYINETPLFSATASTLKKELNHLRKEEQNG